MTLKVHKDREIPKIVTGEERNPAPFPYSGDKKSDVLRLLEKYETNPNINTRVSPQEMVFHFGWDHGWSANEILAVMLEVGLMVPKPERIN